MKKPKSKTQKKKKQKKPSQITDEELYEMVVAISRDLSRGLKFGLYTEEDILQEAWIWAKDALPRYTGDGKLFNFLYTHIKYRLMNLRRNKYERIQAPCVKCPLNAYVDGECTAYQIMEDCSYWMSWKIRNDKKKNLASNAIGGIDTVHADETSQYRVESLEEWQVFIDQFTIDLQIEIQLYRRGHDFSKKRFNKMIRDVKKELGRLEEDDS